MLDSVQQSVPKGATNHSNSFDGETPVDSASEESVMVA